MLEMSLEMISQGERNGSHCETVVKIEEAEYESNWNGQDEVN
jgi:hypothetical protein